jgi:hypothetical protein
MKALRNGLTILVLVSTLVLPATAVTGGSAGGLDLRVKCTPGYKPCIPLRSSDVDCYGGSGNGPRYTKPGVVYQVKRGYDRYRLDADRDGLGCER